MRYHFLLAFILTILLGDLASGAPPKRSVTKGAAQQKTQLPEPLPGITIMSIIPAQGEPGTSITLYGTGFSEKTVAYLGSVALPTRILGPQQLSFDIPQLKAGLYALFLRREDGSASKTYNFTILPLKPVAESLSPDHLHACAGYREREITVHGRNFAERAMVLFDGAVIRSRRISDEALVFSVPQVSGGLHQIQVRSPEDTGSTTLGLYIDARPEIDKVYRGEEFVNYYNLVLEGKNFQQGGTLVVEDKTLSQGGSAIFEGKRYTIGTVTAVERDRVIFVNCTKLIYQRYPYDSSAKDFRLQVIAPTGEGSAVIQVSAP